MRVLIINSVCGVGSTGRIATDLYNQLVYEGNECYIAYGRGTAPEKYNTYKISNKLDTYWHVFETRFLDNHGFASRRVTKKFINFIEEYNPDVIHLHNIHGYFINIKILFGYLQNFSGKIIWTLHDQWAFSQHAAIIYKENENSYVEYPKVYIKFNNNLERKKEVLSTLKKDKVTVITPSLWLSNTINHRVLPYNSKVINNGIDLTKFYIDESSLLEKKYSINGKKIILGCTNIWNESKGIDFFINLSKKISDDYKIVLIGKMPKKYRGTTEIVFIEQTQSIDELRQWYSNAYVFFNPTQADNFPTVNLESLACGTPIVTFGIGGSGEVVNKKTGRIISNIDEFINLLAIVNFSNFQKNCIEESKRFSKEKMINEYINIYK